MMAMLLFFTFGRIAKEKLVFGNADGNGIFSTLFFFFLLFSMEKLGGLW